MLGGREPPESPLALRAGPLELSYEHGALRYVSWNGCEVIRRIYPAVRDRNWGTPAARISLLEQDLRPDSFCLAYEAVIDDAAVGFRWRSEISGGADGRIEFSFEGTATRGFLRNRIGFCVLHPVRECRGARCRVQGSDGRWRDSRFPDLVDPVNPFNELTGLMHEVATGLWCRVTFVGDLFEMEDQRNWVDGSYKTFCTPLHRPFPVFVEQGTMVSQRVRLDWQGSLTRGSPSLRPLPSLSLEPDSPRPIPALGVSQASDGERLTAAEVHRLRAARFCHLRTEISTCDPGAAARLRAAAKESVALQTTVEAVLTVGPDARAELLRLREELADLRLPCTRWIVLSATADCADGTLPSLARGILLPVAPASTFGGGTDFWFAQLNRTRPAAAGMDHVSFTITPQVHGNDEGSLLESLEAHSDVIETARSIYGELPIVVSTVTLRMRNNPAATSSVPVMKRDSPPPDVDPRQPSLFAAAWTLASFKQLAGAGVAAVSYYETCGSKGLMERATGSRFPAFFQSQPGAVFPAYHVFADISEFHGGSAHRVRTSRPREVDGLWLQHGVRHRLIACNLSLHPQEVHVRGPIGAVSIRRLNADTAALAMHDPTAFRTHFEPADLAARRIVLAPCELVTMDWEAVT